MIVRGSVRLTLFLASENRTGCVARAVFRRYFGSTAQMVDQNKQIHIFQGPAMIFLAGAIKSTSVVSSGWLGYPGHGKLYFKIPAQ